MKRGAIILGLGLTLSVPDGALAQARPDFSGTWRFNQGKSSPGIAGNTPNIPFPSQLVIKQSPTELYVASTSVRQAPLTATYKLDGSKVTVDAPPGFRRQGKHGSTARRSSSPPAARSRRRPEKPWWISRKPGASAEAS